MRFSFMRMGSQINFMSKSSQKSSTARALPADATVRLPTRERGRLRVEALLRAAADVFASRGYDAATMTEVAAQAGSSIGSLYQFFPTKASLAHEVLRLQTDELANALDMLEAQAGTLSTADLSEALFHLLVRFREAHPSFAKLIDTPGAPSDLADGVRRHMRARLGVILRRHLPRLTARKAAAMAAVVQQVMKSAVQLRAELAPPARTTALQEASRMLCLYLQSSA